MNLHAVSPAAGVEVRRPSDDELAALGTRLLHDPDAGWLEIRELVRAGAELARANQLVRVEVTGLKGTRLDCIATPYPGFPQDALATILEQVVAQLRAGGRPAAAVSVQLHLLPDVLS